MPFVSKDLEQLSEQLINKALNKQQPTSGMRSPLVERLRQAAMKIKTNKQPMVKGI